MKAALYFIVGLAVGAAGGAIVTKYILDAKTEGKILEASADARNFYKEEYEKKVKKVETEVDKKANDVIASAYRSSDANGRIFGTKYSEPVASRTSVPKEPNYSHLYLVDADESGMDDNYTQCSLDYYQDGILVDDQGNIIENVDVIAGDYLDELSLENPEIFVRNDITKTEYDICYVSATYEQPGGLYD